MFKRPRDDRGHVPAPIYMINGKPNFTSGHPTEVGALLRQTGVATFALNLDRQKKHPHGTY